MEQKQGIPKIIDMIVFVFYPFRYDSYMGLQLCGCCGSSYWEMQVAVLGTLLGTLLGGNFGR